MSIFGILRVIVMIKLVELYPDMECADNGDIAKTP